METRLRRTLPEILSGLPVLLAEAVPGFPASAGLPQVQRKQNRFLRPWIGRNA